ncbi:hypothetical protein CY0110_17997 [Crocosphaera chwakensis CCY0110]|uniref:Uncharacterized protein n=1 Tax=Crocosphaera chwakensis CCY0110 TaxID=391612 RepID=A3IIT1_9CHRO|nr:hypothetical protein CY0110_17997 [Crocosphaera chwakensis CCY0110]
MYSEIASLSKLSASSVSFFSLLMISGYLGLLVAIYSLKPVANSVALSTGTSSM